MYVTMVYDYLEGPLPEGWVDVKTVWFVLGLNLDFGVRC